MSTDDKYMYKTTRRTQTAAQKKKLGEIFIEKGILTPLTVERMVKLSVRSGRLFGALLEDLGLVSGDELAEALADQHELKIIKGYYRYKFAQDLLDLIPIEVAVDNSLFPLKKEGGKLAVAMADPTNTKIIRNIASNHSLTIVPYASTRSDVHKAITVHYLKREISSDSRKKILVVEDDKKTKDVLSSILGGAGYDVRFADDGIRAFQEVISIYPDVIITEKEIRKLHAFTFLESVRSFPETSRTPVILLTPSASADEEAVAFERGFFDMVPKPLHEATLLVKVKRAVASSSLY